MKVRVAKQVGNSVLTFETGVLAKQAAAAVTVQYGETLGYDRLSSGGMADVQMNLAMLPEDDLRAISDYLLSLE